MSVKPRPEPFFSTLVGRLTLAYSVLSGLVFFILIVILHSLVFYKLDSWSDDYLEYIANEFQHYLHEKGADAVQEVLQQEAQELDNSAVFLRVLDDHGRPVDSSDLSSWSSVLQQIGTLIVSPGDRAFKTFYDHQRQHSVRVYQLPLTPDRVLQIGVPLQDYSRLQLRFWYAALICLVMILSSSLLLGRYLAGRSVAGIKQVTHAARLVAGGRFLAQVPYGNHGAEIDELVDAFNQMVQHINQLMNELREVSNNIAHDLRSPLTRIRSAAEIALRERQGTAYEQQTLGHILQECERLNQLISDILEIASIDARALALNSRQVNFKALIDEASDLFIALAEEKGQQWTIITPKHRIYVQGDQSRLQRAVANLLDNAVKYTPPGGNIILQLQEETAACLFSVCNDNSSMTPEDMPRIFDRFYRGDRSRSAPGHGLGLSYAKAIVQAHSGTLEVETTPTQVCFFLRLPK